MALQKKKQLYKIIMYADNNGVLQNIKVAQMWHMKDSTTGKIDADIGGRIHEKEFEKGDTFPASVKTAILNRLN